MLVDLVYPSHELCPSLALFEMASGFGLDLIFLVSLASTRISFWSYHHRLGAWLLVANCYASWHFSFSNSLLALH